MEQLIQAMSASSAVTPAEGMSVSRENAPGPALRQVVRAVTAAIDERFDPGAVADLRRGDIGSPSAAFWRIVVGYLEPMGRLSREGARRDDIERRWAVILAAIARTRGLHDERPLGRALAEARVVEMRLLRLLQASGPALHDLVRTATHQLVGAGVRHNPLQLAELILSDDDRDVGAWGDGVRRRIARDYYRASHQEGTS